MGWGEKNTKADTLKKERYVGKPVNSIYENI